MVQIPHISATLCTEEAQVCLLAVTVVIRLVACFFGTRVALLLIRMWTMGPPCPLKISDGRGAGEDSPPRLLSQGIVTF